jgi:DNA-binding CsgD family transcriptional regulator
MSHKYQNRNGQSPNDSDTNFIGKFSVDEQHFRIIRLKNGRDSSDLSLDYQEVTRFRVRGHTLAIVEEMRVAELEGETHNMIARLTGRELQIAAMIAQGDATKNVAYKLRISEWTVGTHLRRIFAKLGVDNRAAMVYRCASLIDSAPKTVPKIPRTSAPVD